MSKRKVQRLQQPTVDQLNSEESRKELEQKMFDAQDSLKANSEALAVRPPVVMESIAHPKGDRLAHRNSLSGKFMRRSEATAMRLASDAQKFAEAKSEQDATLTNAQLLRSHLLKVALDCKSEKSLIGLAKIYETLIQEATGARALLEAEIKAANTQQLAPLKVVIVAPTLMFPEMIDGDKPVEKPKLPSFAESEVVQQNGPSRMPTR